MCNGTSFTSIFAKTSLFFNCLQESPTLTILLTTPHKPNINTMKMSSLIITNKLLDEQSTNRGLLNVFTGQKATPEQANDMLSYRKIGLQYVSYKKPSSVNAPLRCHNLLTMLSVKQSQSKRLSSKDQEAKQVIKCLRRQLAWCNQTKLTYNSSGEQYFVLPRALADEDIKIIILYRNCCTYYNYVVYGIVSSHMYSNIIEYNLHPANLVYVAHGDRSEILS